MQGYKDKLVAIYAQHNPAKLGDVDSLLATYADREQQLYEKVCAKYLAPPDQVHTGAANADTRLSDAQLRAIAARYGVSW